MAAARWTATEVNLPGDALSTPSSIYNPLLGVSCSSPEIRAAVGQYLDSSGYKQAFVETQANGGSWSSSKKVMLPSGGAGAGQDAMLSGISCTSDGNCTAVGEYSSTSAGVQPMIATETNGTWNAATQLASSTNAGFMGIHLRGSAGNSPWAVGQLFDLQQPLAGTAFVSEGGGTWGSVSTATAPSTADSNPGAEFLGVSCSRGDNSRAAVGTYDNQSENNEPLFATGTLAATTATGTGTGTTTTPTTTTTGKSATPPPGSVLKQASVSSRHHSAKFTFAATGDATRFQCALVREPKAKHKKAPKPSYSKCSSPKTYKHLKRGSYEFFLRAVGPGGTDATPATHRFKIS